MGKICKNCVYFVQVRLYANEHNWGDCMKPKERVLDVNGKKKDGVLKRDDETCSDFKPKQSPVGDES
jgi:hypothetical protein